MKVLLSFLLLCLLTTINANNINSNVQLLILGDIDNEDSESQFLYARNFRKHYTSTRHICGGSIIGTRWILTAAHCIIRMQKKCLWILVGTNQLYGSSGNLHRVEYLVHHSNYSKKNMKNDIGLIALSSDIQFNNQTQPVRLPKEDFTKTDYPAVLTGWGALSYPIGATPNTLREIELKVISLEQCNSMWNSKYPINEYHICTLNRKGQGACHGDSGGPLVADGIQIGIVSFGSPCARGYPDVFTRVYKYIDWINEEISKFYEISEKSSEE